MTWSLALAHGDLTFDGHAMGQIQGGRKTVQDLACAILEPAGTDDMHPHFGSTIDGGIGADGNYHEGIIGSLNDAYAQAFVDAEIRRIISAHQAAQVDRNAYDISVYGRSTLTADEVVLAVENIDITQAQNQMLVAVSLQTGTGSLPINIPLA